MSPYAQEGSKSGQRNDSLDNDHVEIWSRWIRLLEGSRRFIYMIESLIREVSQFWEIIFCRGRGSYVEGSENTGDVGKRSSRWD